jgi:hypothetical protein
VTVTICQESDATLDTRQNRFRLSTPDFHTLRAVWHLACLAMTSMPRHRETRSVARRSSRSLSRARSTVFFLALLFSSSVVGALNVEAASLDLAWTGPTTNADGTPLTDLAGYRIYLASAAPPPCPDASSGASVASSAPAPVTGEAVAYQIPGLAAGTTYVALITAVDSSGNESGCAGPVSGVAWADLDVSPGGVVNFGSTTVGTTTDASFTVKNATASRLTGSATVGAPFSVVSGGSFSLAPGASQAVIVRLASTTAGTFASNVTFTANGDTVSRTVTGSATSPTGATLVITRNGTGAGTVTSTPAGITCGSTCTETVGAGASVTLGAAAASGSTFSGWSGGCSGTAACALTLNADTTVTATFDTSTLTTAPVPVASSLSPSSAGAGTSGLTLTVSGSGFLSSSVVRWNGADRATTLVGTTQLRAAITASDLATAGSVPVSVFTPAPGGGTSATLAFTVTVTVASRDIVIDNAEPGVQDAAGGRTFTGTWCLSNATNQFGPISLRSCGSVVSTYRWTPTIPASGTYDVYVWIPKYNSHSTKVPILVVHAAGSTNRSFDEQKAPGGWVLHGRYSFMAGTAGYVQTSTANGAALADAVRFVPLR